MSNSRQLESLTLHTIKKALSSVCEVDIKVERKVEINEIEEARREASTQTEPLPELKSVDVQI